MFRTKSKSEIGEYLSSLINRHYKSNRQFCKEYLIHSGDTDPSNDSIQKMANRVCQIKYGNKEIQIEDLPIFSELLDVSIEEILSAGTYVKPVSGRTTNYSISFSDDSKEWEAFVNRDDKLFLNPDEYNKTVIDYALENSNYELLKYLMDQKYIWFVSNNTDEYYLGFGAGTNIKRREVGFNDCLDVRLKESDDLRYKMISLAIESKDIKMLSTLHAREIPEMYSITPTLYHHNLTNKELPVTKNVEAMIKSIAHSDKKTIDYFFSEFNIKPNHSTNQSTYIFPYTDLLLKELIKINSKNSQNYLKRTIEHNKKLKKQLVDNVTSSTNAYIDTLDWYKKATAESKKQIEEEYTIDTWRDYYFYPKTGFIIFRDRPMKKGESIKGLVSNAAHVKAKSTNKETQRLIDELNNSYDEFKECLKLKEGKNNG